MFDNINEYARATENASINQHGKENRLGYKFGILNLFLLTTIGVMAYVNFDMLKEKSNLFNGIVLNTDKSDSKLLEKKDSESVSLAINNVVSNSSLNNDSFYTKALLRELDRDDVRTIVVQKGDTLASLSLKYYGNALAYDRIISSNSSLSEKSHTIFPGQKLNLPY